MHTVSFFPSTVTTVRGKGRGRCHRHCQAYNTIQHNTKFVKRHIERVPGLRVLGVTVNDKLTAADHVATLLSSGTSAQSAVCDASAALAWYPGL